VELPLPEMLVFDAGPDDPQRYTILLPTAAHPPSQPGMISAIVLDEDGDGSDRGCHDVPNEIGRYGTRIAFSALPKAVQNEIQRRT
jgi:hypothetical protein